MIPANQSTSQTQGSEKEGRFVSQLSKIKSSKGGVLAWVRELFAKLSQLVRTTARKATDLVKRSPLVVAAAAAIAMLLLV